MVEKIKISVLVQTKNEVHGIGQCLLRLTEFDEVIVVDSNSQDGTQEEILRHGVPVVQFLWDGRYPKKKQWQLENLPTKHEWILFLDADEGVDDTLLEELRIIGSGASRFHAYDIALNYTFAGKALKHGHRVVKRCLVRRGFVEFPEVDDLDVPGMGELEGHYQPAVSGDIGVCRGRINHHDLDPVSTWFARHNRYSDWEAALRVRPSTRSVVRERRSRQGRLFDLTPGKPLVFFVYSFLLRKGLLDGRAGFDYAVALATYYWQIGLKERELRRGPTGD